MKKFNRQQRRQRQKITRRSIVILCAATVTCLIIGITIFIHLSNVNESKAANSNLYMVPDQEFITEKSIETPVVTKHPERNPNTINARQLKTSQNAQR